MLDVILRVLLILLLLVEVYKRLVDYQQNQYILKRYLKTVHRKWLYISFAGVLSFFTLFLIDVKFIQMLFIFVIGFIDFTIEYNKHYKIKFKFTKRVLRFSIIAIILAVILNLILPEIIFTMIIIFSSLLFIILHYITYPIELLMKKYFINKAKTKLKHSNAIVVGITGSYGKTSSKNILYDVLKHSLYTLKTPASYNTPMGISLTVNNELEALHQVFIAEMGAYKVGEIKENCQIAKPKIGIITTIGKAHLESFGSVENILHGKFELIESLPSDGLAVLNADDELLMSYEIKNPVKVLKYSILADSDLQAYDLTYSELGTQFKIDFLGNKYDVETKLLGQHNVYNILACILVANYLGIAIEEIIANIASVKQIKHRLEVRKEKDYIIIDDAFNSNPVGAKAAANVLKAMNGYKVVMTPGMIELGSEEYALNKEFGLELTKCSDFVILVGNERAKPFIDAFDEVGFHYYLVVRSVDEGFKYFFDLQEADKILLIENDLPDIY